MYFSISRIKDSFWFSLLIFIFLRPFLSEYAFLNLGFWYIFLFIIFSLIYIFFSKGINLFFPPLNLAVTLFLSIILISLIFKGFTLRNIYEFYLFLPNFLIFYIISKIDLNKTRQILNTVLASSILICIYAIYQYLIGLDNVLNYIVRNAIKFSSYTYIKEVLVGKRAFATFVSPNLFASYLIMILFLGLGIWLENKRKMLYLLAVFLISLSLIYTKSIGAILTFMLVFIFWLYFFIQQNRFILNKRINLIIIGAIFFIFVITLAFIFINRHKISHFFDLSYTHNSIIQRLYYWQTALKMIKDYPLLGIGWSKFGIYYYFYKPNLANMSHYAHNVFLQITAELGIFGLLAFLSILFFFLKESLKIIKKDPSILKFSLLCSGISFLIHNLSELSFYFGQISFFWWLILGLLNSLYQISIEK